VVCMLYFILFIVVIAFIVWAVVTNKDCFYKWDMKVCRDCPFNQKCKGEQQHDTEDRTDS
jgi:hypothetical protein